MRAAQKSIASLLPTLLVACATNSPHPEPPPPADLTPAGTSTQAIEPVVAGVARVVTVAATFTTQEGAQTPFNLDVAADLEFAAVKRYTVSFIAPPTMLNSSGNSIAVRAGVLQTDPLQTSDVTVFFAEAPGANGGVVGPFVGSNAFLSVVRGDDGLGPIEVAVNAYIELLP